MDREKGSTYTYYMLSQEEVEAVEDENPGFLTMTNELPGGRKRVVVANDSQGETVQQELERVIKIAGFQIVDTPVPKTSL